MRGIQYIRLRNDKREFEFKLKRKITILTGDSGIGKSAFVSEVLKYLTDDHLYDNSSSSEIIAFDEISFKIVLNLIPTLHDYIVIMDENIPGLQTKEMADVINRSDCYFLIITREKLCGIPYAVDSIVTLRMEGSKYYLEPLYKGGTKNNQRLKPDYVVCEDRMSGFVFFKLIDTNNNRVYTACGKDNVIDKAIELCKMYRSSILIIADGAAMGSQVGRLIEIMNDWSIHAYLGESFEYLLLHSPIFNGDTEIEGILRNPFDFIESRYASSERYFTSVINRKMKEIDIDYSKSKLCGCFVDVCCRKKLNCFRSINMTPNQKIQHILNYIPIDFSNIFVNGRLNYQGIQIDKKKDFYIP